MTDGSAFGLTIRGIPIDVLSPPIPRARELTWLASHGAVPGHPKGWVRQDGQDVIVGWGGWADYRVSPDGSVVARVDGVAETEAGLAFVVSVLPLALPVFGLEPLHGSAVSTGAGAILMLGRSGAGKSTLAAVLDERGLGFVADDACAFDRSGRLWSGPAMLNPRSDDLPHPIVGEYNGKLVRCPLTTTTGSFDVQAIVVLDSAVGASLELVRTGRSEAFTRILGHARVPWFLEEERRSTQLQVVSRLAARPTSVLRFDPTRHDATHTADLILAWATESASMGA
jgi:hypothetical protein